MLGTILGYLGEGINACLGWFSDIIESTGTYGLIIGVFTMIVMFRVLIVPLIGSHFGAASDRAADFSYKHFTKKGRQEAAAKSASRQSDS